MLSHYIWMLSWVVASISEDTLLPATLILPFLELYISNLFSIAT